MKVGLGIMLLAALPAQAHANGLLLVGPQIGSSLLVLLGSSSQCLGITYDPNGNRVSQASTIVGSTAAVWGTDKYGCKVWG